MRKYQQQQQHTAHKKKTPSHTRTRWAIQWNTLPTTKISTIKRLDENRNVFD
jgi:diketogulonate reductase-like aldo/keto reductase